MVLRNKDEQDKLVELIGKRMENILGSIPTTWTDEEIRYFAMGSAGTLEYLAKELLPDDIYGMVDELIESQIQLIMRKIEKYKK
jgi:hypothetical protein